ncbi:MAG TPA: dihydrofolate reductase family protein [archaeon]|nr:dihydrofolate reductase family protein [archaeon]
MGKKQIILYVASSLDGFIARTNGDVDWLFSRNKNNVTDEHVTFVHEDVTEFIEQLSPKDDKKIWLVGGAMIIAEFLKYDLIDEFILSIHPVLLGNGIPLFNEIPREKKLKFIDVRTFDTGLVQVYYTRNGTRTGQ